MTWNHAKNDPINRRIKVFHYEISKMEPRSSSGDFSPFSRPNLEFKHSLDEEMSL